MFEIKSHKFPNFRCVNSSNRHDKASWSPYILHAGAFLVRGKTFTSHVWSQQFGERPDLDSTYLTTYIISTFHLRGSHLTIIVKLEFIRCWLWVFIHFFTRRQLPIADNHSETENLLHHQELVMSQYSTLIPFDPSSELQFHNFRNLGSRHIWINGYVTMKFSLLLHLSTKYQAQI